ncbi:MAG: hypothetical protein ACI9C2_001682 [Gammaproteobacteria bacterium]
MAESLVVVQYPGRKPSAPAKMGLKGKEVIAPKNGTGFSTEPLASRDLNP